MLLREALRKAVRDHPSPQKSGALEQGKEPSSGTGGSRPVTVWRVTFDQQSDLLRFLLSKLDIIIFNSIQ